MALFYILLIFVIHICFCIQSDPTSSGLCNHSWQRWGKNKETSEMLDSASIKTDQNQCQQIPTIRLKKKNVSRKMGRQRGRERRWTFTMLSHCCSSVGHLVLKATAVSISTSKTSGEAQNKVKPMFQSPFGDKIGTQWCSNCKQPHHYWFPLYLFA